MRSSLAPAFRMGRRGFSQVRKTQEIPIIAYPSQSAAESRTHSIAELRFSRRSLSGA
ncbi:hypothetical protein SADFL11_00012040 [Roseibium alexandrii DFL-11]|uniref:Uncharacterized protein n=1 Tax=Roseibium alexandrii (strain DSM 17067 / NCIMB 14079 / DFL-11) TaxID=244592 RepID=A0A5E8UX78_ROSAD|nr:hypothetical protein SADFL11_00012040 [Roseibium alexandrii DFL-11]